MTTACDSSDIDDDFNKALQPLIDSKMYFVIIDEPTESEKQVTQAKSYISDSLILITHMNFKSW